MIDLKLVQDGDLQFNHKGDLILTENPIEYISQKIQITLKTIYGEWFLDPGIGVGWVNMLGNKDFDEHMLSLYLKKEIEKIKGVKSIPICEPILNREKRLAKINLHIITDYGKLTINKLESGAII